MRKAWTGILVAAFYSLSQLLNFLIPYSLFLISYFPKKDLRPKTPRIIFAPVL